MVFCSFDVAKIRFFFMQANFLLILPKIFGYDSEKTDNFYAFISNH